MHMPVPPLNHTHSATRFLAPRLSAYRITNVALEPDPLAGVTVSAWTPD